jgi:hypothetical protein
LKTTSITRSRLFLPEPSTQQRVVAQAAEIGKQLSELPPTRTRTVLTAVIERVEVRVDQIDIHLRPTGLTPLFDVAVPLQSMLDEETLILSVPARLRRAGMEIKDADRWDRSVRHRETRCAVPVAHCPICSRARVRMLAAIT